MHFILLDTNILIYREGERKLDDSIQLLSRLLLDSEEYKLCIHPLSLMELKKHKNEKEKSVILSKANIYKKLENPPKVSNEFLDECGNSDNTHDINDATLLYMLRRNCVNYLITNDKRLQRKSEKVGLRKKVFSISEAINLLFHEDSVLKTPIIITETYLYNLDSMDSFFDTLREDYKDFDNWLENKKKMQIKAYVSFMANNKIGALLILKVEDKSENYETFDRPFNEERRVKVSTFKVADNGKSLGEAFIKIIVDYALKNNINEIYVTAFDKQEKLIELLLEFGFQFYTYKKTIRGDNTIAKEAVYLKKIETEYTLYPIIKLQNQQRFVIPIQYEYSHMLFPDVFDSHQISMQDIDGTSTYSNAIKKAYISRSKCNKVKSGDILIFYSSEIKKSLICVGVVDDVFRANEINDFNKFEKIIKRRTVYQQSYLKESFDKGYLIILFKYYLNLPHHITLTEAQQTGILNGPPQSIQSMSEEKFIKLIDISRSNEQIKI